MSRPRAICRQDCRGAHPLHGGQRDVVRRMDFGEVRRASAGNSWRQPPEETAFLKRLYARASCRFGEADFVAAEKVALNLLEAVLSRAVGCPRLHQPDRRSTQSSIQPQRLRHALHRFDAERDVLFQIYAQICRALNYVFPVHATRKRFVFHLLSY